MEPEATANSDEDTEHISGWSLQCWCKSSIKGGLKAVLVICAMYTASLRREQWAMTTLDHHHTTTAVSRFRLSDTHGLRGEQQRWSRRWRSGGGVQCWTARQHWSPGHRSPTEPDIMIIIINHDNTMLVTTGCPVKLFQLCNLLFYRLLLIQIAKVGTFLKNSENLLHDRHKNFENRFRNSWDNWGQSWQPSFRNWHFAITQCLISELFLEWNHNNFLYSTIYFKLRFIKFRLP